MHSVPLINVIRCLALGEEVYSRATSSMKSTLDCLQTHTATLRILNSAATDGGSLYEAPAEERRLPTLRANDW